MPKKLITPAAPQIIVPALNRRQILGGLGALALPVLGCGGSEGDGGTPGGVAGSQGFPGGSGVGGSGVGGSGNATGVMGGSTFTAGSGPGPAGSPSVAGSGQTTAGAPNGGSGNVAGSGITGGTSPGGAPGSGGTSAGAGGTSGGAVGSAGSAGGGSSGGGFLPIPDWAEVPSCTASKTDAAGQGPFFIHEMEKADDVSMLRQDLRGRHNQDAEPGIEFQFHLRFLTAGSCNTPIKDLEIYIWNTDAQGYYSGFGIDGTSTEQKPDVRYSGSPSKTNLQNTERFCRGYQLTDENGVVSFKTIYPGFYNGRHVHTHLVVLKKGSMARGRESYTSCPGGGGFGSAPSCDRGDGDHIFTSQIYYNEAFTRELHTSFEPYKRRTSNAAWADAIKGTEQGSSGIRVAPTLETGDIVRGQLQIIIDPTRSVGGAGG